MNQYCMSCGAPLWMKDFQGPAENYCKNCTDERGELKTREEIQIGMAQWLKTWQPNLDNQKAMVRAISYLKAMPAWAD